MLNFLNTQLDYIYFFYGLGFFFLSVVCFTIEKEKRHKFPWLLLGSFGLIHGFNEWADMFMIIYGKHIAFEILSLLLLSISFLVLLEFSRVAFLRLYGKTIPVFFYAPLVIFTVIFAFLLGRKFGLPGDIIAIRYSLGFPSAYLASRAIYEFSKKEPQRNLSLVILSLLFALYAVTTGFVTPKAEFVAASLINFETFQNTFGVPVQLLKGFFALSAAIALWFYSSTFYDIEYNLQKRFKHFIPTKWTIALTLVSLLSAGWFLTNYFEYYAGIQMIKNARPAKNSAFNGLMKEINTLSKASVSLARSSAIRHTVAPKDPQYLEKAKSLLAHYKDGVNASSCILLDMNGLVILSTDENTTEFKKEKPVILMPYFKEAISGDNGYFFRLTKNYNERIYYISYPVKNIEEMISGVVVIVKNIHVEPILQYRLYSMLTILFVCIIVITFFLAMRKRESLVELIERANTQLQEIDQIKTDFVSIVSHELRTPLTSIKGATAILLKGGSEKHQVNEEEKELLGMIVKNVDRQTRMINDLLDVSKIESGMMPISIQPIELIQLIKDVVSALTPMAKEKELILTLSTGLQKKTVSIDQENTRRILTNLLVNAIKFTPDGGKVTVKAEDFSTEVRVTIIDTGVGISNIDKKNIFNKFYRSQNPEIQHQSGFGLGLLITKGLVEAQGGEIWVESELGEGSSFYFTLPCRKQK